MPTAIELLAGFANKTISPVTVMGEALAAIARDNPTYNAWVHIATEQARAAAQASEQRWAKNTPCGPLDGIPIGVKDLIAVANQPMRRGSPAYPPNFTPTQDAPIIARLRSAGAIPIGKTATPDAGCKLDTTSLTHGTTKNPHNPTLTAGGSSGGSATAIALNHTPIAIGTDGAGSIRIPAAFTGIFGLKPTTGRIPAPVGPFWPHATTGPMSKTVLETALTYNTATKPDPRDPYSLPYQTINWITEAQHGIAKLKIAIAPSFNGISATPTITNNLYKTAAILEQAGASITTAEPAWPCNPLNPFITLWRSMYAQSVSLMPAEQAALIDPFITEIVAAATQITRQQYQTAIHQRDAIATTMAHFHTQYDLLITPVSPCQPWQAGHPTPPPHPHQDWSWCPFTYPFNLTKQPAASVPTGTDENGMPLAIQIIAAFGQDSLIMRAALVIEAATS